MHDNVLLVGFVGVGVAVFDLLRLAAAVRATQSRHRQLRASGLGVDEDPLGPFARAELGLARAASVDDGRRPIQDCLRLRDRDGRTRVVNRRRPVVGGSGTGVGGRGRGCGDARATGRGGADLPGRGVHCKGDDRVERCVCVSALISGPRAESRERLPTLDFDCFRRTKALLRRALSKPRTGRGDRRHLVPDLPVDRLIEPKEGSDAVDLWLCWPSTGGGSGGSCDADDLLGRRGRLLLAVAPLVVVLLDVGVGICTER
jgi:hypothetical protein